MSDLQHASTAWRVWRQAGCGGEKEEEERKKGSDG